MQIISDFSPPLSGASITLAQNLIARLEQHYPAYAGAWRVNINERGGVVEISNMRLSGRWGFLMHIAKIDSEGRKVVRAAGELLERYQLSRSRFATLDQVQDLPRDFRGELVVDRG